MMEVKTMDPAQEFEAKLLTRMKPLNELTARGTSAMQQFYSGATVFVTGGSGFLGKQLIEKLLRATKVSKIFVLLRSKKGKSIELRLTEILQDPLYNVLREEQPDYGEKLVPVSGDAAELRLGLSEKDWNTITEQVDVVFHLAATTRFDETLRVATLINVRGTREALILGKTCKNLRSFVYVSTAYSHACLDNIDTDILENFYKSPISPNAMIELVETVEEARINDITPSLTKNWPNTYAFSKSIAEELVNTIGNDLPVCVVRPAIVVCTKLEPIPGWIDMSCIYGATGVNINIEAWATIIGLYKSGLNRTQISDETGPNMLFAAGLGVLHTTMANTEVRLELAPVDYVNNAIIAAGWETARRRAASDTKTKIYVISPSSRNPVLWREHINIMRKDCVNYPTPMMVGPGFVWFTKNPILFWIYSWLLHLIPAYIIDGICAIIGKEKRFVKLTKKMYKMTSALSPYTCYQWKFDDQNTAELYSSLSKEDRVIFNFGVNDIDWTEYIITWCIGVRKYILKDGLTDTLYARKKVTVLKILMFIFMPLYFYSLCTILYFALSLFMWS